MRTLLLALLILTSATALVAAAPAASACTNDHCNGGPCRVTWEYVDTGHMVAVPSGMECGPS